MFVRLSGLCLAVVGLVGCALYAPLTDSQYEQAGRDIAALNTCVSQGHMRPEVGATGMVLFRNMLDQRPHDKDRLENEIRSRSARHQSLETCRTLEVSILSAHARVNGQNAQAAQMYEAGKAFTNSMPKQTICNRIGTQTFCSTY